jgi:transcriptional regulator of arginine metabolism
MQHEVRPLSKSDRQRLIGSVVARKRIGSQQELLGALEEAGCRVTQATVSRDLRELGLEKVHDALGRPRYTSPERAARSVHPRESLAAVLAQFGRSATPAQNIVVVHSELGSAPAVARALDRLEHPRVVGTLAGDDTCLVIAGSGAEARSLARELNALIE